MTALRQITLQEHAGRSFVLFVSDPALEPENCLRLHLALKANRLRNLRIVQAAASDEYLAACNLTLGSVTFYRRVSVNPVVFEVRPEFELKHESLHHPDGLGFSRCGSWLAVANHGNHSVSIFRRRRSMLSSGKIRYGPQPVMVLKDPAFRHPHSVAFTPLTDHLVVTNAGANYFSAYQPDNGYFGTRWAQSPCCKKAVASNADFRRTNDANAMEGGPKGIAVHQNQMAVCSPKIGIKIFSFRERPQNSRKASAPN